MRFDHALAPTRAAIGQAALRTMIAGGGMIAVMLTTVLLRFAGVK
jgi:hypothetical protein